MGKIEKFENELKTKSFKCDNCGSEIVPVLYNKTDKKFDVKFECCDCDFVMTTTIKKG